MTTNRENSLEISSFQSATVVCPTTVALVERKGEVSPASSLFKQELLEVGLQSGRRLLKHAAGQSGRVSQALIVGVIAHLAMGSPWSAGYPQALAMSGEVTMLTDKAEGATSGQPSKPRGALGLKGQQALRRADDHVVALPGILNQS